MSSEVNVHKLTNLKIDPSDAKGVLDFWLHFDLHLPDYLQKAADNFEQNPNVDTQDTFRGALCKALHEGKEDVFQDDLFKAIRQNSDKVLFNYQFLEQLEDQIGER